MKISRTHTTGYDLSALISASPSAKDSKKKARVKAGFRTARVELTKRKREWAEETERKRAREIKELGPFSDFLDYSFKAHGYIQSYGRPFKFKRNDKNPRVYNCSPRKLLSLENINWMKAHSIEHLVFCQEGDFPLPDWWKDTGMSFCKASSMNPFVLTHIKKVLSQTTDACVLIATDTDTYD
ncbi:MAG: hypothetical protein ACTSUE_02070 [Promethearchaeota archaeon]